MFGRDFVAFVTLSVILMIIAVGVGVGLGILVTAN